MTASRTYWVLWRPCGCPTAVMDGSRGRSKNDALAQLFGSGAADARAAGWKVTQVSAAVHEAEVVPLLIQQDCRCGQGATR